MTLLELQLLACSLGALCYFYYRRQHKPAYLPYPPGPWALPLIGNLRDMPTVHEWETFERWAKDYGDITHIRILGQDLIIVNSERAIRELLEKRAENTSGRNLSTWTGMFGEQWILTQMSGEEHRERRAFVQRHFVGKVQSFAARVVMVIGYGHAPSDRKDPFLTFLENLLADSAVPMPVIDALPFLRFYPEWLPFSGFKRFARETYEGTLRMRDVPFNICREQLANGTAKPTFVTTLLGELADGENNARQEQLIRDGAGVMFGAGSDTTASSMASFFAAMALEPHVQARAQEEIDRVVGSDRLPTFADRSSLPYIDAVIKEIFRWNSVTPAGIPHRVLKDDMYNGFLIPRNALILGNEWAVLHDPAVFPDPQRFNPEHFFGERREHARELIEWVFGWGRRSCPGRYLAEASVYIAVVCVLACCNITKPRDEHDEELDLNIDFSSGFVRRPLPFKCTLRPRSEATLALLQDIEQGA